MPLNPGTRIGPYEIVASIGAGGMGEVYRARDTRLGRDVAIKVLPESFARDAERMRRFEQEARAIAALNHPNVLAIFDTGTHDGSPYLVSELLEGESLRQRLQQGPVPARKAMEYAHQAADGLAAAHEKGIVHRDLKPENLFLTSGGRIKILDFGLAKMQAPPAEAVSGDEATATFASPTTPGVVLGTTGYMAPEQVRGENVDHRADIFGFGATLYEMLSGKRAFKRDTMIETMNAILKDEPPELDVETLHVSPGLERVVRHCLEKKPGDRFQSARDLAFALGAPASTAASPAVQAPAAARRSWIRIALLAAALAFVAIAAYLRMRPAPAGERAEFAILVPGEVIHVSVSSDGRWLAFVSPGDKGSEPMVYVQRVGVISARVLPGTAGASYPFWSPDGSHVAFFANGKLKKVAVGGGEPQNLVNVTGARGGSWGSKGVIIYAPDYVGALWRVNADGTGAASLTDKLVTPNEQSHRWPVFLPDGDHFLTFAGNFNEVANDKATGIYFSSLSKLEKVEVMPARSSPGFAAGSLHYVDANGALVSVRMDTGSGKTIGEPRVVAPKVAWSPATYYGTFAVAGNGTVIYSSTSNANYSQLTWFDAAGKELGRVGGVGVFANPTLSPDGTRVAYDSADYRAKNVDIWISDLVRGGNSRFTFNPEEESTPLWSRDGATIAYRSVVDKVHLKKASGFESAKALPDSSGPTDDLIPTGWSLDGRQLLCTYQSSKGGSHLAVLPATGGQIRTFVSVKGMVTNGQISPDGKLVAYASNETGDSEIYVTTFPDAAGKWQVSHGGGAEPRWRGDGKEIFYLGPSQMLTAIEVNTEGSFTAGTPRPLFEIHGRAPISSSDLFTYDVTRDGKRFLVNQYVRPQQVPPLGVILNADAPAAK